MQFSQGNNPARGRVSNQTAILRMIYQYGPIKRAEIARRLGLTLPPVTASINRMIAAGLVRETGPDAGKLSAPGRKANLVDLAADSHRFLGIEMRGASRTLCIADLRGQILYRRRDEAEYPDYRQNLQAACALIRRAAADGAFAPGSISGMGVTVPGLVDAANGILKIHPGYGWRNKDLRRDVAALTGYTGPIAVDNNVCARAAGAQLFRRELLNSVHTFAYLFISSGIACPLILNTSEAMASLVGAGEVGHMVMDPNGPPCSCGHRGCLEAFSSDRAVISACRAALAAGGAPQLRSRLAEGAQLHMADILAAQQNGDADVQAAVEKALQMLGIAVANITNFSGPDKFLIEGELFALGANRTRLTQVIRTHLYSAIHSQTEFVFVDADPYSGALGAAAAAICQALETFAG